MRKYIRGLSLIELCVALTIVTILFASAVIAHKNYKSRHHCHAAAQVLVMDLKLQQQRSRTLDEQQGILFVDNGATYYLGQLPKGLPASLTNLIQNSPPRVVHMSANFGGVRVESLEGNTNFPNYIYFDPKSSDASGNWILFSGFSGKIVLKGNSIKAYITVRPNGDISYEVH